MKDKKYLIFRLSCLFPMFQFFAYRLRMKQVTKPHASERKGTMLLRETSNGGLNGQYEG